MTDSQTTAVVALREAASALDAGRLAGDTDGHLPPSERPAVAGEVANVLDALIGLLRAIDHDAATTSLGTTDLDPVLAHLASGSTLARSVEDRGPNPLPGESPSAGGRLADR